MSNSPIMDMFYRMYQDGERDPEVFLAAGKEKSELCLMMHVNRYLKQFDNGLTPDKVKRQTGETVDDEPVHSDDDES